MRSVVTREDDEKLYYVVGEQSKIEVCEKDTPQTLWSDYAEIGKPDWNIFRSGLFKVYFYPDADGFQVLFIAHHLLGDGRAIAALAFAFAEAYANGKTPTAAEERLIKSIDDLPAGSALTGVSLTNLGTLDCPAVEYAAFIPPASPATVQTVGALTVNRKLRLCSSFYTKALSTGEAERQLNIMVGRARFAPLKKRWQRRGHDTTGIHHKPLWGKPR